MAATGTPSIYTSRGTTGITNNPQKLIHRLVPPKNDTKFYAFVVNNTYRNMKISTKTDPVVTSLSLFIIFSRRSRCSSRIARRGNDRRVSRESRAHELRFQQR